MAVALRPREMPRIPVVVIPPPAIGRGLLFNLHTPSGPYYAGDCFTGNVLLSRSDQATPPFAAGPFTATDEGGVTGAALKMEQDGRLHLHYAAAGGTYLRISPDHGATWSTPTMVISNGTAPFSAVSWDRMIVIDGAVVGSNLVGVEQDSGDPAPSAPFTFSDASTPPVPLLVDGSGAALSQGWAGDAAWMLHVRIQGDADTSEWESTDYCRTWTRRT